MRMVYPVYLTGIEMMGMQMRMSNPMCGRWHTKMSRRVEKVSRVPIHLWRIRAGIAV